jgi:hypothetical protein
VRLLLRLRAWRLYFESALALADVLDAELERDAGIPLRWYDALVQLEETPDGLRMNELAERILYSKSGFTRVVDRLEEAGLVNRDDLVFADGAIHLVNTGLTFSFTIDPRTCIGKVSGTQSIAVVGGTGRFAHATGSFAGVLAASGIAPRNVDGTCDEQSLPPLEVDHVSGTGNLSF